MRVYDRPRVYLIAKTTFNEDAVRRFLKNFDERGDSEWQPAPDASDAERLVEASGRVCYLSFWGKKRPTDQYIAHILESKHGSVLEHASWTFLIEGISRACSHELVRHRHLSFSQLSQRFAGMKGAGIVIPPLIRPNPQLKEEYVEAMKDSFFAHEEFEKEVKSEVEKFDDVEGTLKRKLVKQTARYLTPQGASTIMVVSGNARAWRHVIELRASRHADTEIRVLANRIYDLLVEDSPRLFGDFERVDLGDGTYELVPRNSRV